jgi:DNA-binding transcriptional ArsR family regulator
VKSARLGRDELQAVAELFGVLSEPTRLRILQMLHDGSANVSEIVERLGIKQANASKQLGILRRAGVLAHTKNGTQVRYSIKMPLVFDLCTLVCDRLRAEAQMKAKVFS